MRIRASDKTRDYSLRALHHDCTPEFDRRRCAHAGRRGARAPFSLRRSRFPASGRRRTVPSVNLFWPPRARARDTKRRVKCGKRARAGGHKREERDPFCAVEIHARIYSGARPLARSLRPIRDDRKRNTAEFPVPGANASRRRCSRQLRDKRH